MDDGIGPSKLHSLTSKTTNEWRFSIEEGRLPEKLVPANLKNIRELLWLNSGK